MNIQNPSLYNTIASNLLAGDNIFTWTIINGICIDTDNVNIQFFETIVADAGNDNFICDISEYQMLANTPTPGTGIWSCDNENINFHNISLFNTNISNLPEGTVNFTWTITNGICGSTSDNFNLLVSHTPTVNLGDNIEICEGETYTFYAPPGYDTYLWHDLSSDTIFVASTEGMHSLTVTNICGTASDNAYLIIRQLPTADAGSDTTVCQNDTVTLFATGGTEYIWNNDVEQAEPFAAQITETYKVTVISEHNCIDTDSVTVFVNPAPQITGINTDFGHQITVTAQSDAAPLLYALNSSPFQTENTFIYLEPANYWVTVKDTNNCTVKSNVIEILPIEIPTVFTPNGDGINDRWEINELKKYVDSEVFIFDSWGKFVTSYKGTENGWDGTSNGAAVKADTYWYVIKIDNYKSYKGSITVVK